MLTNTKTYGFNVSKPAAADILNIEVEINPDDFLGHYVNIFRTQMRMKSPLMFKMNPLTEEEFYDYFIYLFDERVKSIRGTANWRQDKLLVIPTWIQYVITQIGQVFNHAYGLKFNPFMNKQIKVITIDEALAISNKLALYADVIALHKDAMPRSPEGNEDVMSCVLLSNHVKATKILENPESTYVAAFAGVKLREEAAFNILYRISYDDVDYIRSDLTTNMEVVI